MEMKIEEFIRAVESERQDRDLSLAELTDVIDGFDISENEAEELVARLSHF